MAAGDIGTILKTMSQTAALKPSDYIKKTTGVILHLYYTYVKYFHLKPCDLTDMIDGLLFMNSQDYIERYNVRA